MRTPTERNIMTETQDMPEIQERKPFFDTLAKNGVGLVAGSIASLMAEKAFDLGMAYIRARKLK